MNSGNTRPVDPDIMDAVFVSRPSDLSDLEDILPSLDDVLSPQADFASDSELPLWDNMLSTLSCPGMDSLSNQTVAPGLQEGGQGLELSSAKGMLGIHAQQASPSVSACSCDAQHVLYNHPTSQHDSGTGQAKAPHQQQEQTVRILDEPTSSRDSNPGVSSPDTAQDKSGSTKKRKMDDSDEDCSGKHPSPASDTTKGEKVSGQSGEEGDEEQKRTARMQRNRESAMLSRQRKKMQLDELDRQNKQLQATNTHLTGLVAGLASENAALRHQLAMAGHPAPPPFAPPPAPSCTPGVMPVHQAPPYTPWQFPGVSYMPSTPKVPIPQLKSQGLTRPAKPTAKKAKVAAGGTALLGLVTLLCLTGTIPSWPGSSNTPTRLDSHVVSTQTALPLSLHAGGRVLQSVNEDAAINATSGWNSSDWLPQPQPSPGALAPIPLKSAVKASSTKALALQHLKDLAPITLYTDWGLEGGVSNVWRNVQGSGGRGSDLKPPMQCREVFRLDAAQSSNSAAARRHLQNYLASLSSFRGRALMGPIAMPPTSRALPPPQAQDGDARSGGKGSKATIGCEGEEDDLIVSIMLPSPQAGDDGKDNKSFTSVDEVYVVAVRPAKEYVTYACSLQSPVLV